MGTPLQNALDKRDKDSLLTYLARNYCKVQKSPTTQEGEGIIVKSSKVDAKALSQEVENKFDIDPENTSDFNKRIKERKKELGIY